MTSSFSELFKANFRILYRNRAGAFWMIALPIIIYIGVSFLPVNRFIEVSVAYPVYLLPGLVAMVIMQSGIYSLAYWVVELRARGVITRFLVTPINPIELVLSLLSSRVIVNLVQALVLTTMGIIFFGAVFAGHLWLTILAIVLGGFLFLLVGLFISTFGESYESIAPITAGIGLPLTFLSNIFYPLETLPEILQKIAQVLPITHFATVLRKLYLESSVGIEVYQNLGILLLWLMAMLLLVIWRLKRIRHHFS